MALDTHGGRRSSVVPAAAFVIAAALLGGCGQTTPPVASAPMQTVTVTVAAPQPLPTATTSPTMTPSSPPAPTPPATPSTARETTSTPVTRSACAAPAGQSLRHAPGADKTVALTFDDGPGGVTPQVREILRRYGVRATFFDVGERSARYTEQEAVLAADGHLIADHTWDHLYPRDVPWTIEHLRDQIRRTQRIIELNTGTRPCFFRPPGGVQTNVAPSAQAEGLQVVMWSHDTLDWAQPAQTTAAVTAAIVRRATTQPGRHPVILMHVAKASNEPESKVHAHRGNTVAALPTIIEWYRDHGYRFVDVAGDEGLQAEE